ncbi:hypothetical protein ATSB10_34940 [Dyella thiooxydans]|uniref:Transmembrane protein n=1 Tax=Dyella thiooxydans TaxID=445710 RepID=A0A160N5I6_9GAMM|nr:DUF924 family protein [Dyella thiooxydans]AND70948.1 hypothetical protein ATSB10_34940 [Dyella thiooxydans]
MVERILDFWFVEAGEGAWWAGDPAFDELVRSRFGRVLAQASFGELWAWRARPRGRLAEILVLDQFSRNIHRGTPAAFACDPMALVLAQEAVAADALGALSPIERCFVLMPYMHSESPAIHIEAERLFREHAPPGNLEFELRHKAIIDRFGRYPHRNAILRRPSTPEELAFLDTTGSSF